jgi:sialate O-acetylesterase
MKSFLIIGLLAFAGQAMAQLSMPNVFGDHMVLQAGKPVKLWGKASPDAAIRAEFGGQQAEAQADSEGRWTLHLPKLEISRQGAELKVSDGADTLRFEDVLVGEVWFASGQSNMEWPLTGVQGGATAIAEADIPEIRFFQAKNTAHPAPQDDVEGEWKVSHPQTAGKFSAVAYFFAHKLHRELEVPVGIVQSDWGGKPVETFTSPEALKSIPEGKEKMVAQEQAIAGFNPADAEKKYQEALKNYEKKKAEWEALPESDRKGRGPRKPRLDRNPGYAAGRPATLWNGMIHPLVGYTLRGAIWYQGESNRRNADEYGALFSLMIEDWRRQWGDEFRFLWVQLANYQAPVKEPGTNSPWAVVQEHQRRTLRLPKTGMAVINDIGDAKDIHPRNKKDVGERLARWALADDYGKDIVKSGPLYRGHSIDGGKVTVNFHHVGKGLMSRDGKALQRFEIQDNEGIWRWATAKVIDSSVVISHPGVDDAAAVRYAWAANPEGSNLVNSEGLPASLFTTEWPEDENQVAIPVEGKDLAFYQAAPLKSPVGGDKFKGSNFIHPLKTPSGFVVTDNQPKDHAHHFGLWWPWKYIELDGRKILCWELQRGDGMVRAESSEWVGDRLITKSVFLDRKVAGGPKVRLHETTEITVSGIVSEPAIGYFLNLKIDHQVAGDEPIKINKFRYSGLGYRATALWNIDNSSLLTSEGAKRPTANGKEARWIRVEGTNGKGGTAGVLMMGAPSNHNHPERLRTWNKHYNGAIFVNFNPVMGEPWTFEPGTTYTRNYRIFVYDGSLSRADADLLWEQYAGQPDSP